MVAVYVRVRIASGKSDGQRFDAESVILYVPARSGQFWLGGVGWLGAVGFRLGAMGELHAAASANRTSPATALEELEENDGIYSLARFAMVTPPTGSGSGKRSDSRPASVTIRLRWRVAEARDRSRTARA
jgi:hypothetical protein